MDFIPESARSCVLVFAYHLACKLLLDSIDVLARILPLDYNSLLACTFNLDFIDRLARIKLLGFLCITANALSSTGYNSQFGCRIYKAVCNLLLARTRGVGFQPLIGYAYAKWVLPYLWLAIDIRFALFSVARIENLGFKFLVAIASSEWFSNERWLASPVWFSPYSWLSHSLYGFTSYVWLSQLIDGFHFCCGSQVFNGFHFGIGFYLNST